MGLGSPSGRLKIQNSIARVKHLALMCSLYVGNVSKCRCLKWPRMSHLDIYSTSYGWKKGRESNWQFDSRPLKVGNRPDPGVCRWSATHRWKAFKESYKFASDLIPIGGWGKKLWTPKVPRIQTGTISGLHFGSLGKKCHSDASAAKRQRILYGGRWWLPLSRGRGESNESVLFVASPNTKSGSKCDLSNLLVGFDAGPSN
jgi:hypothetical protein